MERRPSLPYLPHLGARTILRLRLSNAEKVPFQFFLSLALTALTFTNGLAFAKRKLKGRLTCLKSHKYQERSPDA